MPNKTSLQHTESVVCKRPSQFFVDFDSVLHRTGFFLCLLSLPLSAGGQSIVKWRHGIPRTHHVMKGRKTIRQPPPTPSNRTINTIMVCTKLYFKKLHKELWALHRFEQSESTTPPMEKGSYRTHLRYNQLVVYGTFWPCKISRKYKYPDYHQTFSF